MSGIQKTAYLSIILLATALSFGASIWWTRFYIPDTAPSICSARRMLSGLEAYTDCYVYPTSQAAQYPMTTILISTPFSGLPKGIDTAALWSAMNGILVYAILRSGRRYLWLVFLTAPYALAFIYQQYSPLTTAVMLLPGLLPLAMVKPQTGLPVILTHLTPWRAIGCAALLAATFVIYPLWPVAWVKTAQTYDGVIPLLVLPFGPLLLVALLGPNRRDAWTLFLFACMPSRNLFDLLPLMTLAKNRYQLYALIASGWMAALIALPAMKTPDANEAAAVPFVFLPLLVMQLAPKAWGVFVHQSRLYQRSPPGTPA